MTNFATSNTSIMPNKIPLTNLERVLRRIKSPLTCLQREIYRVLIVQIGQNGNFYNIKTLQKTITGETYFKIQAKNNNIF